MMRYIFLTLLITVNATAFSLFGSEKATDKTYVEAVRAMKQVVIATQKTRGLTNNYMNGNVVAQLLVYGERTEMKKAFENLKAICSSIENVPPEYRKRAKALMKEAARINKKAFRKKASEVFVVYTKIIEGWIALSTKIVKERFSQKDPTLYHALLFQVSTLLPLTENIGKMRGMGSGIVARGECRKEEVPKMLSFAEGIEKYRVETVKFLKAHPLVSKAQVEKLNAMLADYAALTKEKVIGKNKIMLDPNKYFDQGTACISEVSKVYDAVSKTVDAALQ